MRRRQGVPSIVIKRPASGNTRVSRWICAALIVLAILPYLQTLRYEFVNFDDGTYVAQNPLVRQGLTWSNVAWAWTTMSAGNWHPVTWLSHMLDCQIFGLRPGWHHLVNALLHGANAALVFVVLPGHDRRGVAQRIGGGVVCAASIACRVSGLDRGTQRCVEHLLWSVGDLGLREVCRPRPP